MQILTISLDYIEIPLLLKFIIPIEGSEIRPSIFAGHQLVLIRQQNLRLSIDGQSQENDFKDDTKSRIFFAFGGGIGFPVGNGELGVDIRYILGMSTFDDSSDPI